MSTWTLARQPRAMNLKRMLINRVIFSTVLTVLIGLAYLLSIGITTWLCPLTRIG